MKTDRIIWGVHRNGRCDSDNAREILNFNPDEKRRLGGPNSDAVIFLL